jgi:hypothetical protein
MNYTAALKGNVIVAELKPGWTLEDQSLGLLAIAALAETVNGPCALISIVHDMPAGFGNAVKWSLPRIPANIKHVEFVSKNRLTRVILGGIVQSKRMPFSCEISTSTIDSAQRLIRLGYHYRPDPMRIHV